MNKLKKGLMMKALPWFGGALAFVLGIAVLASILGEIMAVISSDAGYHNKRHEEEVEAMGATLQPFTVSGTKSDGKYNLTFSFSGWKIKDIVLDAKDGTQEVMVKIPGITGKNRAEMAFRYFVRKGFTKEGAAGLVSNIATESAHTFSAIVEEGSYGGVVVPYRGETVQYKGFGLCQWTNSETSYGRRYDLIQYMKKKGFSPDDNSDRAFLAQLEYAITEPGYESIVKKIKSARSASEAAEIWCREWERPANVDATAAQRGRNAEEYLREFKNSATSGDEENLETVKLSVTLKNEGGTIHLDGTLNGVDIAATFTVSGSSVSGTGEYGQGASSYKSGLATDENGIPMVPLICQWKGSWDQSTQSWKNTDWPNQSYDSGNLANSGCGITSAAMAFSAMKGELINPIRLANSGKYIINDMVPTANSKMGTNYKRDFGISWESAVKALKEGNMVIALMNGNHCPGFSSYTGSTSHWPLSSSGAHFILLIGIKSDGTIAVADPGSKMSVSYWYKNQKTTIPQSMIRPAFVGSGSTIIYVPQGSSGNIGNPYGTQKFAITDVALAWRMCPYHGRELHDGWDFALGGNGTPIYSVTDGEVVHAGPYSGYGDHVVVIKSGDMHILYGHMGSMSVSVGQKVRQGEKVGTQGSEGYSTGPHLHLEFRKGGFYGQTTANKDAVVKMLQKYAYNYSSYTGTISEIVR